MKRSDLEAAINEQRERRESRLGMERSRLLSLPVEPGFATIVTGVRRCGKSTLLDQWVHRHRPSAVALRFDDLRLASFSTEDFSLVTELARENDSNTILLDEVQDIPGWERYVAAMLATGMTILITGSNATLLSREFGTKLTGRHLNVALTPFTYGEYLRFTNAAPSPETLEAYLQAGGFPAYLQTRRREVLTELFNDILYRDIVVRYGVRDVHALRSLALFLLGHAGSLVSPSRLAPTIGIRSAGTILEYFSYLEETYLLHRLPAFAESSRARLAAPKKIYACDTGLVSTIEPRNGTNFGHKLENLVYQHLLREDGQLFYHKNRADDAECDFLLERRDGSHLALQVAWILDRDNEAREIAGVMGAMKRFDIKEGFIITRSQSDRILSDGRIIHVIPAHSFLLSQ